MKKTVYTKAFSLLAVFMVSMNCIYAQQKQTPKFTFTTEVLPYLLFTEDGAGNGFQVGLARSFAKGRYKAQLTYGMNKYSYQLSGEYIFSVGGVKQFIKKADENIFTPANERVEGIPDQSKYEILENAGFKHFKPDDGAYITNYITAEVLRDKQLGKNWKLEGGLGGQLGLMNLNDLAGAVVSELYYPLSGNYVTTNVTFRISAKYLYYGFTGRAAVSRKITDHFSVGSAAGVHVLMGKRSVDMVKPYLSLMALFTIN